MGRTPGASSRRVPIVAHLAALAVVLVVAMAVVGTHASFSSDEGAAILQAKRLSAGEGWVEPNPFPTIDPTGEQSFVALSEHGTKGTAFFAKHATYPLVLAAADRVGGVTAMVLLSVIGCVLAAWAAWCVAARLDPRLAPWALWATGVGSPLLFDSQTVIAHTLGAALCGGVVLALLRARERWSIGMIVIAVVLLLLACLQRNEALLLAVVLAGIAVWDGARQRDWRWIVSAGLFVGAAAGAYLIDRWLLSRIVGAPVSAVVPVAADAAYLSARVTSFVSATILVGDSWPQLAKVGLLVMVIGTVAAALVVRLRPDDRTALRVSCGVAVLGSLLPLFGGQPDTIPSLLVACPVVLAGLVLFERGDAADDPARYLWRVVLGFVALVLLLQYNQAGAAEWGARFLALILPVLVPLALLSIARRGARVPQRERTLAIASLATVSVVVAGLSLWSLRYYHGNNRRYAELVGAAAAAQRESGRAKPVVVTDWIGLGRLMWPEGVAVDGLTITPDDARSVFTQLHDSGVRELVMVSNDPAALLASIDGLYELESTLPPDRPDRGPVFLLRAR